MLLLYIQLYNKANNNMTLSNLCLGHSNTIEVLYKSEEYLQTLSAVDAVLLLEDAWISLLAFSDHGGAKGSCRAPALSMLDVPRLDSNVNPCCSLHRVVYCYSMQNTVSIICN